MFFDPLAANSSSSSSTLGTTFVVGLAWLLLLGWLWSIRPGRIQVSDADRENLQKSRGGLPAEFLPRMLGASETIAIVIAMCAVLTVAAYAGSRVMILVVIPILWLFVRVVLRRHAARIAAVEGFPDFVSSHSAEEVERAREVLIETYGKSAGFAINR